MKELLEAGVHFGHQTRRWNPKMRRYIFTERGGIYIIDLQQTQELIQEAHDFARNVSEYEFAGGVKGSGVPVVRGKTTDLLLPAHAELVVEGVIRPGSVKREGPFGEFTGYYGKPEETEAVFADGWFRTGDIVTIDEAGFVRIVDRIKELIITGGFNVAPTEVENALRQHPHVEDAAVVGLPSEHSGEEVVAAIVVSPGQDVDVEAVREFARGILTPYKVPRRIYVVDELPKSLIGKVLRRQVRDRLLTLNSGA